MPNLLEKDKIVLQPWYNKMEKLRIKEETGIEYLLSWIDDRIWQNRGETKPKIKLRGVGSKVLVLRSATGSGKSTVLPQYLYNEYNEKMNARIIITEPTRLTTTEIPMDIIKYNKNMKLGENIGYQTGLIARKTNKGILFTTIGILLQYLKILTDEELMKKAQFIIIDEIHNRSIDTDLVLYYMKQFLSRNWENPDCPLLILTSGTFEPEKFMKYFKCPKDHFIDVLGFSHPIENHFSNFDVSNYMSYILDLIEKIHIENINDIFNNVVYRDIIVFLQGKSQIIELSNKIHYLNSKIFTKGLSYSQKHNIDQQKKHLINGGGKNKSKNKPINEYYLLPIILMSENISKSSKEYTELYSNVENLTVDIYKIVDEKISDIVIKTVPVSRRIMLGSNAIETGITINTLKYCIDSGFVKDSHFNPNHGCNVLVDKNVTQASSRQRRGRVGRNAPGIFYACYTEETYNYMPKNLFPDIVKENITSILLAILIQETKTELIEINYKNIDDDCFQMNQFDQKWYKLVHDEIFDASKLDFIQYPSSDSLSYSLEILHGLGFIDHEYFPTIFGIYCNKFKKLKLESIRMILAGYHNKANILDLITIACFIQIGFDLGIKKNKYVPRNPLNLSKNESYYYYKFVFCDEFIEYLFIWNDFMMLIDNFKKIIKNKKSKIEPNKYLLEWCKENSLNLSALLRIIELRDEVIIYMLSMGLNPYYNGLGLNRGVYNLVKILNKNINEGLEEIKNIKCCIYEGYRYNLFTWNKILKKYINRLDMSINIDSKLTKPVFNDEIEQAVPQKIIIGNIIIQEKKFSNNNYDIFGSDISIMDGFVDIDKEFLNR